MKKSLLFFLVIIFLPDKQLYSQCVPQFFDGFESGSYSPTWAVGSSPITWSVTATNPAAGTYRLEGNGGDLNHLTGLSTVITSGTPANVSWWIYPTGTASGNYVVLGDASVSATNCISFCYWQGGTNIRFVSSTTLTYNCAANQWYHIEMRNINYTTHTFDIYIDGVLQQTAFPFRSATQNSLSNIHLYNYNATLGIWDNITIGNAAPLQLSDFVTDVTCNGGTNGSIDLTATSTNPGAITYLWSNGATTEDVGTLQAGAYGVLVTDALGCTDSLTDIVITEPSAITAGFTFTSPLCHGDNNGTATISASGGTPGYTYLWSNTQSTATATGLSAGMITCLVTDTHSCTYTDSVMITEPQLLAVSLTGTGPATCGGSEGSISTTVTGGTPGFAYDWSIGDTTAQLSSLPAGNYAVMVTDMNGCVAFDSTTISDPIPTAVTLDIPEDSVCVQYPSFTLTGASLNGGAYSGPGVSSGSFNPATAGIGSTMITYTYTDTNNCVSTTTDNIVVSPCLGMEDENEVTVAIYPNPFSSVVFIQSAEPMIRIEWMDVQGKTISVQSVQATQLTQSMEALAPGVYFIRLRFEHTSAIYKVVKE